MLVFLVSVLVALEETLRFHLSEFNFRHKTSTVGRFPVSFSYVGSMCVYVALSDLHTSLARFMTLQIPLVEAVSWITSRRFPQFVPVARLLCSGQLTLFLGLLQEIRNSLST